MEIPKSVKISGIIYTVEEVEGMAEKQNLLGRVDLDKAMIFLEKDMSKERKEQTFIHEVTHCIYKEAGYENQDEDMINRVAIVLHQVLKDNNLSPIQEPLIDTPSITTSLTSWGETVSRMWKSVENHAVKRRGLK